MPLRQTSSLHIALTPGRSLSPASQKQCRRTCSAQKAKLATPSPSLGILVIQHSNLFSIALEFTSQLLRSLVLFPVFISPSFCVSPLFSGLYAAVWEEHLCMILLVCAHLLCLV